MKIFPRIREPYPSQVMQSVHRRAFGGKKKEMALVNGINPIQTRNRPLFEQTKKDACDTRPVGSKAMDKKLRRKEVAQHASASATMHLLSRTKASSWPCIAKRPFLKAQHKKPEKERSPVPNSSTSKSHGLSFAALSGVNSQLLPG